MPAGPDPIEPYREINRAAFRQVDAAIRAFNDEMAVLDAEVAAGSGSDRARSRALTRALLRKLDRLDNGGTAPAG